MHQIRSLNLEIPPGTSRTRKNKQICNTLQPPQVQEWPLISNDQLVTGQFNITTNNDLLDVIKDASDAINYNARFLQWT